MQELVYQRMMKVQSYLNEAVIVDLHESVFGNSYR